MTERDAAPVRTTGAGGNSGCSTHRQVTANLRRPLPLVATAVARADALAVACSALTAGVFEPDCQTLEAVAQLATALAFDLRAATP
jgi:hypothetical protein